MSLALVAFLCCCGVYLVQAKPVIVFNKGNITIQLYYNETITKYVIYGPPDNKKYTTNETRFNITNTLDPIYKEVRFDIYPNGVGPVFPMKYKSPKIIPARVGQNVSMELKLARIPLAGYTIKILEGDTLFTILGGENELQTTNIFYNDKENVSKFMIVDVQLEDAGHIVATEGTNQISTDSILLVVTDKPTKPDISTNGSIFADKDAVFFCNAESTSRPDYFRYKIPLSYTWYLDNDILSSTTNKQHVFKSISKSYKDKKLTCEAVENSTSSDLSDPEVLDPLYGPRDVIINPNISRKDVIEGASVGNFSCSADCNPKCKIKWTLRKSDGTFIPLANTTSISIGVVNRTWTGKVRCVATGTKTIPTDERKGIKDVDVNILYPPLITSVAITPSVILSEDQSAMLICSIDSNPESNSTWVYNDAVLIENKMANLTYKFKKLECRHTGNYTCMADNGLSSPVIRHIFLNITCSPRLDLEATFQKEYGAQMNIPLTISFQVISNPQPYISLDTRIGSKVEGPTIKMVNLYTYTVSTTITVVDLNGFGSLMVRIGRKAEEKNYNITIKAAGIPSKAENLTIVPISYKSVNLTWIPGFDGGDVQNFKVYKLQDEIDWNLINTVTDFGNLTYMTLILDNLSPRTSYSFKVESCNTYGCSNETALGIVKTDDLPTTQSESTSLSAPVLIGTAAAAFVVILGAVTIIAVVLWNKKKAQSALPGNQNEVIYTKVANIKTPEKNNDLGDNNVYANEAAAMISDKKENQPQPNVEDIGKINRTQNKDGLIYIDVEFSKPPEMNKGAPTMAIHGDDERTEYMSVDFTQKAPVTQPEENLYGNT